MSDSLTDSRACPWAMDLGAYEAHAQAYRRHVVEVGHGHFSVYRHVAPVRHFCLWLVLSAETLDRVSERLVEKFAAHECRCDGTRRSMGGFSTHYLSRIREFMRFLAGRGVIAAAPPLASGDAPEVEAYLEWLRLHRGLRIENIRTHRLRLRRLLPVLGADPGRYDASLLRGVFLEWCAGHGETVAARDMGVLRSWIRYNASLGRCREELLAAVPSVTRTHWSGLARGLEAGDVERLLASCDVNTVAGLRDRAIMLLLARLGLRAGDVTSLTFDRIDWKSGHVRVTGKGRRDTRLPLPQEVGDAILVWLEEGRPPLEDPHVFLCVHPPWRPIASSNSISQIVTRALARAGLSDAPCRGAQLLRHSVACGLLKGGVSLESIAALLRHRSLDTTSIYARVDVGQLREIAQPWPGGASC